LVVEMYHCGRKVVVEIGDPGVRLSPVLVCGSCWDCEQRRLLSGAAVLAGGCAVAPAAGDSEAPTDANAAGTLVIWKTA